jgi:hypothetical protein
MLSAALHNRLPAALAAALVVGLAVTGDATAQSGGGAKGADQTAPTPVAPPPHGATPMQEHMSGTADGPSRDRHGTSSTDPVILAYQAVNEKMHRDMMITFTGDADRDFVAAMIPHHQGAIDMAEVVLKYGKDPEIRKLAQGIIAAQQKEIARMNAWLVRESK